LKKYQGHESDPSYGIRWTRCFWFEHGEEGQRQREGWQGLMFDVQRLPDPPGPTPCTIEHPQFGMIHYPEGATRGFAFLSIIVETPKYLATLRKKLVDQDVKFIQTSRPLKTIKDVQTTLDMHTRSTADKAIPPPAAFINCLGLGGRDFHKKDKDVVPIRGVLLKLALPRHVQDKIMGSAYFLEDHPTHPMSYIFPREDACYVGGCAEEGIETTHLTSDEEQQYMASLFAAAVNVVPELSQSRIERVLVGLRPSRTSGVRTELERLDNDDKTIIIHNYGHGGSGWTLCWGSALKVASILQREVFHPTDVHKSKL
jgi:D-amino-acid oxidase